MGSPETEDGRIQPAETRLSREEYSPQQFKEAIQSSIDKSEDSSPIEIEIVGENEKWSLRIPPTVPSLIKALPLRQQEETRNRFFNLVVDPALENAIHVIIREV
ncbi:MAG: hypothetical protein Q7S38_00575 [bacterium]|nr:hypothetical protein [bacterium]